jgi:hypothetical protein
MKMFYESQYRRWDQMFSRIHQICYAIVMSIKSVLKVALVTLAGVTSVCSSADVNSGRQEFLKQFVSARPSNARITLRGTSPIT